MSTAGRRGSASASAFGSASVSAAAPMADADLLVHPLRSLNPAQVADRMRAASTGPDRAGDSGRASPADLARERRRRASVGVVVAAMEGGGGVGVGVGGARGLLDGGQSGSLDAASVLSLEGFGNDALHGSSMQRRSSRLSPIQALIGGGGNQQQGGLTSASASASASAGAGAGQRGRLPLSPMGSPDRSRSPSPSRLSPGASLARRSLEDAAAASGLPQAEAVYAREMDRHSKQMKGAEERRKSRLIGTTRVENATREQNDAPIAPPVPHLLGSTVV